MNSTLFLVLDVKWKKKIFRSWICLINFWLLREAPSAVSYLGIKRWIQLGVCHSSLWNLFVYDRVSQNHSHNAMHNQVSNTATISLPLCLNCDVLHAFFSYPEVALFIAVARQLMFAQPLHASLFSPLSFANALRYFVFDPYQQHTIHVVVSCICLFAV